MQQSVLAKVISTFPHAAKGDKSCLSVTFGANICQHTDTAVAPISISETLARRFFIFFRVFRFARLGDEASSAEIELALAGDICAVFDAVVSLPEKQRGD